MWTIHGYDGTKRILGSNVPGNLSDSEISILLSWLAARDLAPQEVIDSSKRRNQRGWKGLLDATIDWRGKTYSVTVGDNPHYIAFKQHV